MWRLRALYAAVRSLLAAGGVDLAASLAFFGLLSIFPAVGLGVMIASIVSSPEALQEFLARFWSAYFPASQEYLEGVVVHLFESPAAIGGISAVGLIGGAAGLLNAVNRSVNKVLGMAPRPPVQRTAVSISLAFGLLILFLASVGLTTLFQLVREFGLHSGGLARAAGSLTVAVTTILLAVLPICVTWLVFLLVYHSTPKAPVSWRNAAFGAVVAAVLFEIVKHIFLLIQTNVGFGGLIYDSLWSVIVLLLWAYTAGLIFLYGAAVTKESAALRPQE